MTTTVRSTPRARASAVRLTALVAVLVFGILTTPGIARAHTDFESSTPADGETVEGPLDDVVVNFTNPAEPSSGGFEVLGPSGRTVVPTSIDETDGTSFVLHFDPPLPDGAYGVRWEVVAGDAHPIDGAFRFDVVGGTSATTAATATTESPPTPANAPPSGTTPTTGASTVALAEFVDGGSHSHEGAGLGRAGRSVTFAGTIAGLGAIAALIWVVRGSRDEVRSLLTWARIAGVAIAAGGAIELAAYLAATGSEVGDVIDSRAGIATVLKMLGGAAVWFGLHQTAGQIAGAPRSLSAAVTAEAAPSDEIVGPSTGNRSVRWSPDMSAALGLGGYALVLVSFWFDGHTVTEGPWPIHSLVNVVHVGAAAVWAGGAFAMTLIAWGRRHRSEDVGLAAMVVRFSTIAAMSLAAVVVAGVVLALLVIDRLGELTSTDWGRTLIAKTAAVLVAAALGAYNHFRLRPRLEEAPDDPALAHHLRATLAAESVVLMVVILLTSILVAAAI